MEYNSDMYKSLEFDLARNALEHLIKIFNIDKIHIPYYLCDVVRHTLCRKGCKPIFYHVDDSFFPAEKFSQCDFILYPNYFGICYQNVKILAEKYPCLIVDNAHSYYDFPQGFACFNAGHKFGFKKSVLWFKDKSSNKFIHPSQENFQRYNNGFIKFHERYGKQNLLKIENVDGICSFVYPLLVNTENEANSIVKELKKEGKTIYRYWNPLPKSFNEYKFYSRLIPIPI